jgi:4-amino-4-deoxy-L-arabinose transferase-like glycosyltransferase
MSGRGAARGVDGGTLRRWLPWFALLLVLCATTTVRWRLLDVPLERDEGEYAYAGQLILEGVPPYREVYNMKLPGIYAAYAGVLALFGQTHRGVHLGLLVINAATIIGIFLLGRRLIDELTGVVAAATFAALSVSQPVQGVFANAEHFVILPAVVGLVLLLRSTDEDRLGPLILGGVCLGLGILMKQHGAAFATLGGAYVFLDQLGRRPVDWRRTSTRCAAFALAVVTPYVITCGILWCAGVFDRFWFWTVTYARAYVAQVPLDRAWGNLLRRASRIVDAAPFLWMLAAIGLTAIAWDPQARRRWLFLTLFVGLSFAAVCPGFFFRPHYFVLLLPAAALLVGIATSAIARALARTGSPAVQYGFAVGLAVAALVTSLVQQRWFLFRQTPTEAARTTYGLNPFPESLELARFVAANSGAEDPIAIIGSEPQIFFYAQRRSATGHIYMYGLMELHDHALEMQREMIREIEAAEPALLVFANIRTSWLTRPGSHRLVFEWLGEYLRNYELVWLADLRSDGTKYLDGASLAGLRGRPRMSLEVYRRRS